MSSSPSGRLRGNALVVSRRFRAPIEDVWKSITDSDSTARWYGRWEGTPGPGNQIRVQMAFEDGAPWITKTIEICEPPRRLVLTADNKFVQRLELVLAPTAEGCELELIHHDVNPAMVGDFGPGWEVYLDQLGAARDAQPLPKFGDYFPSQKADYAALQPT